VYTISEDVTGTVTFSVPVPFVVDAEASVIKDQTSRRGTSIQVQITCKAGGDWN
jgi:hypothetical protein